MDEQKRVEVVEIIEKTVHLGIWLRYDDEHHYVRDEVLDEHIDVVIIVFVMRQYFNEINDEVRLIIHLDDEVVELRDLDVQQQDMFDELDDYDFQVIFLEQQNVIVDDDEVRDNHLMVLDVVVDEMVEETPLDVMRQVVEVDDDEVVCLVDGDMNEVLDEIEL